ncbi:hypothetical protein A3709_18850 [Halioglobus sp. HI00S01]|uniref:PilZ domain-containing protein n=1 Tax=Halioglobus sp. HI00S01 TaxID=1822214 RepID=UPI0007C24714|nr:PilZ domain-containing protein [Halioglobus sp. HI00S01]KZX57684.1 hypothetical protein A3709_18850 [Halioglobus sp. HI00S01]
MAKNAQKSVKFENADQLAMSYMPFMDRGGLFLPLQNPGEYKLGDAVFLMVNLPDDTEDYAVAGTIVWITPKGAQNNRTPGIGVQFSDEPDDAMLNAKIEILVATNISKPDLKSFSM